MDLIPNWSLDSLLRIPILVLLLLFQDKNVWPISDNLLFWTYGLIQFSARNHVRRHRLRWNKCFC